jgi:acetolactate synthase regulatory subunit
MSSTAKSTVTLAPPAAESRPCDPSRRVVFSVIADAAPGTLPRVLELVAKRGLVPLALVSRLVDDTLAIEMEIGGMVRAESDHVGQCLRQIPMVARVTIGERPLSVEGIASLLAAAE